MLWESEGCQMVFLGNIVAPLRHSRAWKSSLSGAALHVCTVREKVSGLLLFAQSARNLWAFSKDLTNSNSEMRFESRRPSQPVRLQRVTYEGRFKKRLAGSDRTFHRPFALPFKSKSRIEAEENDRYRSRDSSARAAASSFFFFASTFG